MRVVFEFSFALAMFSVTDSSLLVAFGSECRNLDPSLAIAPCLPANHHVFYHDDNRLNLINYKLSKLIIFLYISFWGHGVSSQQ